MKRAVFWVCVIACMINAAPSSAQFGMEQREEKYLRVPHRFQIFMDGALALPTDPGLFNDYWNTAFQFGIGGGMVIFPWLEVNATFNSSSFNNNDIASKEKIEHLGIEDLEGGTVSTKMYWGSVRFIGVPSARTNPYIEVGVGAFSTSADDLGIKQPDGTLAFPNTMKSVSGLCFVPSVGIQYALNETWSAYTKYTYAVNLNDDFAPGDLLLPWNKRTPTIGGQQVISSIAVGLMFKM